MISTSTRVMKQGFKVYDRALKMSYKCARYVYAHGLFKSHHGISASVSHPKVADGDINIHFLVQLHLAPSLYGTGECSWLLSTRPAIFTSPSAPQPPDLHPIGFHL